MLNYGGTLGKTASSMATQCVKAVAPTVLQGSEFVAPTTGSIATVLFDRAGMTPLEYVEVNVEGCNDVLLTVNYLDGDDCDACTTDTLTQVPVTIKVKANEGRVLPVALMASLSFVTIDENGDPVDVVKETTVDFYAASSNSPCCAAITV